MPTRILIVDDSPLVRELLRDGLSEFPDLQIIGEASDGRRAEKMVDDLRPDVVTMDVVMPMMGGLEAIRSIMARCPTAIVVVASPYNGVEALAMEAMAAGALDVFPKSADFGGRLDELVKLLREAVRTPARTAPPVRQTLRAINHPDVRMAVRQAAVIGIVTSAGGPQTLKALLEKLPATFPVPIAIVQHTARGFGLEFANWLDHQLALHVSEATAGARVQPGDILVAPDDMSLEIDGNGRARLARSVGKGVPLPGTALLRSLATAFGTRAVGIVLTGMGNDGAEGVEMIEQRKGTVIVQEPANAIISGMPSRALERTRTPIVGTLAAIATLLGDVARGRG